MSSDPHEIQTVEYATPLRRPPAKTFAAAMILVGGLALIVLGGCFLIGILITIQHVGSAGGVQQLPLTNGEMVFIVVLAVLALAASAGAVWLLLLGTRALLAVTRS